MSKPDKKGLTRPNGLLFVDSSAGTVYLNFLEFLWHTVQKALMHSLVFNQTSNRFWEQSYLKIFTLESSKDTLKNSSPWGDGEQWQLQWIDDPATHKILPDESKFEMMGNHLLSGEAFSAAWKWDFCEQKAVALHHLMHNIWNLLSPIKSIQLGAAQKDGKIPFSKRAFRPLGRLQYNKLSKRPCLPEWVSWLLIHCGKSVTLIHGGFGIMHMPFWAWNNCVPTR